MSTLGRDILNALRNAETLRLAESEEVALTVLCADLNALFGTSERTYWGAEPGLPNDEFSSWSMTVAHVGNRHGRRDGIEIGFSSNGRIVRNTDEGGLDIFQLATAISEAYELLLEDEGTRIP